MKQIYAFTPELTINGTSRVLTDLSWFFEERLTIVAGNEGETFELADETRVEEIDSGPQIENLPSLFEIASMIDDEPTDVVLYSFGLHHLISASFIKIISRSNPELYGILFDEYELYPANRKQRLGLFLLRTFISYGLVKEIHVLNDDIEAKARRELECNRVRIIRHGVSPQLVESATAVDESMDSSETVTILFNGIVIPRRRLEDLVKAAARLRSEGVSNFTIEIAGGQSENVGYVDRIHEMVSEYELDEHIEFLGSLPEDELMDRYASCDVFVFPADNQSWGLAPLEAMVFEKPAIVSTGCGVSDVLDEDTAIFVPPRSSEAIADGLKTLIEDAEYRRELGENGRQFVLDNFTMRHTADTLRETWHEDG